MVVPEDGQQRHYALLEHSSLTSFWRWVVTAQGSTCTPPEDYDGLCGPINFSEVSSCRCPRAITFQAAPCASTQQMRKK